MRLGPGLALGLGAALTGLACARANPLLAPRPEELGRPAPDSFEVRLETSRGPIVLRAHRDWSPLGVDRLYFLVRHGYYDQARFFRVVGGFVAQFGLSGDPAVNAAWEGKNLPDEPVRVSNTRGRVAYARGGPHSRSVQLYLNLADNVRLDTVSSFGFPPIAEVVSGLAAADALTFEYGGTRADRKPGPSQDSIRVRGNAYLDRAFPRLDFIRTARVLREWKP